MKKVRFRLDFIVVKCMVEGSVKRPVRAFSCIHLTLAGWGVEYFLLILMLLSYLHLHMSGVLHTSLWLEEQELCPENYICLFEL